MEDDCPGEKLNSHIKYYKDSFHSSIALLSALNGRHL